MTIVVNFHQSLLFVVSVIWKIINLFVSDFFESLTKPLIFEVTEDKVTIKGVINSLGSPALDDISIYSSIDKIAFILFNPNLPSP